MYLSRITDIYSTCVSFGKNISINLIIGGLLNPNNNLTIDAMSVDKVKN